MQVPFVSVEFGAREVEDDLLGLVVGFPVHRAVGMEELAGDEREDGGAARGDAAFGDLGEKASQEKADVFGGGEVGGFAGEKIGGEIGGVIGKLRDRKAHAEMLRAEGGLGWRGRETAAHAVVETEVAAARVLVGDGNGCCGVGDGVS